MNKILPVAPSTKLFLVCVVKVMSRKLQDCKSCNFNVAVYNTMYIQESERFEMKLE